MVTDESCAMVMREAAAAVEQQDHKGAERLLLRAHAVGHGVTSEHLAAHRGLVRVALAQGHAGKALARCGLLTLVGCLERQPTRSRKQER